MEEEMRRNKGAQWMASLAGQGWAKRGGCHRMLDWFVSILSTKIYLLHFWYHHIFLNKCLYYLKWDLMVIGHRHIFCVVKIVQNCIAVCPDDKFWRLTNCQCAGEWWAGEPTCSWSVSACRRLPPSAFNQSSISSSCCFPLNSVVPSPADVLLVQTARKSNTPFERHKGFKAGETFWKVANPSFHFAQTPRPGGSRGLDGAIGNLCHKGIMCTESTILQ